MSTYGVTRPQWVNTTAADDMMTQVGGLQIFASLNVAESYKMQIYIYFSSNQHSTERINSKL